MSHSSSETDGTFAMPEKALREIERQAETPVPEPRSQAHEPDPEPESSEPVKTEKLPENLPELNAPIGRMLDEWQAEMDARDETLQPPLRYYQRGADPPSGNGEDRLPQLAPVAHARTTDPATSHAAAARVNAGDLRKTQEHVLEAFTRFGPMTDVELVARYQESGLPKQSESGIRTRRSELVDRGLVADSGRKKAIPPHGPAVVWQPTGSLF